MILLLTPAEVDELTDIYGGKKGQPKNRRQVAQLRQMGIPFHVSASGRPVVARASIEGGAKVAQKDADAWVPAVLRVGA